jgi:hypothetical protein
MRTGFLDVLRHVKHSLVAKRPLWTIGLYQIPHETDIFEIGLREPFAFIGERGIRLSRRYRSTVADPFLFPHDNDVFLFYEVQTDFGVGEIHASRITDERIVEPHGRVLKERFHLSYPQVFRHDDQVWMMPETASDGRQWLYRCTKLPGRWKRERILIDQEVVDASLVVTDDGFYILGTTRLYELRLFHSPSLDRSFDDTGISITEDKALSRNAGRPVYIGGKLLRFAQDCERTYGENINVLEITDLSRRSYSETLMIKDLFKGKQEWMALGCHHISVAPYKNEFLVAIDGMRLDSRLNNVTLQVLKNWGTSHE